MTFPSQKNLPAFLVKLLELVQAKIKNKLTLQWWELTCQLSLEKLWYLETITLQGTNISPKNGILKMIFLFPRWDMLIPWRVNLATSKKGDHPGSVWWCSILAIYLHSPGQVSSLRPQVRVTPWKTKGWNLQNNTWKERKMIPKPNIHEDMEPMLIFSIVMFSSEWWLWGGQIWPEFNLMRLIPIIGCDDDGFYFFKIWSWVFMSHDNASPCKVALVVCIIHV